MWHKSSHDLFVAAYVEIVESIEIFSLNWKLLTISLPKLRTLIFDEPLNITDIKWVNGGKLNLSLSSKVYLRKEFLSRFFSDLIRGLSVKYVCI